MSELDQMGEYANEATLGREKQPGFGECLK